MMRARRAANALALVSLIASSALPASARAAQEGEGASPAPSQAALGTLIDRVVAVISTGSGQKKTLITLSDLEAEARIALISRGAMRAAAAAFAPDTLGATLDWLIAEHLLMGEAEQLAVASLDPNELEAAILDFAERLGEEAYERLLAHLGFGEAELARVLGRRIVVDRYLASRLRLGAIVSEAEVRAAYEAKREELGLESFASAKDSLRTALERQRRQEVVAALVADLRGRSEVRILHTFGKRGDEGAG